MAYQTIAEMQKNHNFEGFLLAKKSEVKVSSNGGRYVDWTFSDRTGEVTGKQWEVPADIDTFAAPVLVKVRGLSQEYNGRSQLRVDRVRLVQAADDVRLDEFIACAPELPEAMYGEIVSHAKSIEAEPIRALVLTLLERRKEPLGFYPAAQNMHHAIRSGLLYHTLTMLRAGLALLAVYTDLNRDLVVAGVILHDLCKIDEMSADPLGVVSGYTFEGVMLGHITMGVEEVGRAGRELGTDPELVRLLQHMVLSHHYEPEYGSPRRPLFPEAELLHYLDILDARLYDMRRALSTTKVGEFSESVWSLDKRRIYKVRYFEERAGDEQDGGEKDVEDAGGGDEDGGEKDGGDSGRENQEERGAAKDAGEKGGSPGRVL